MTIQKKSLAEIKQEQQQNLRKSLENNVTCVMDRQVILNEVIEDKVKELQCLQAAGAALIKTMEAMYEQDKLGQPDLVQFRAALDRLHSDAEGVFTPKRYR